MNAVSPEAAGLTNIDPYRVVARLRRRGQPMKKKAVKKLIAAWLKSSGNGHWWKRENQRRALHQHAAKPKDLTPRLVRRESGAVASE